MSMRIFADGAHAALRNLKATMVEVGDPNSAEVKAAGNVIAREMRKQLSVKAPQLRASLKSHKLRGLPSAPGQPPHRVSGRAYKSIGQEVVGGVRRIGTNDFVLRLMNDGVVVTAETKSRKTKTGRKRKGTRTIAIAPRPWAQPALEAAAPQIEGAVASAVQTRVSKL